jgi:anti-sigma factor RsiW
LKNGNHTLIGLDNPMQERVMEHENAYTLMMDALDGELADDGKHELEVHLRACPACSREWHLLTAIDTLFKQTPALSPAADFAQRTLARLPNRSQRIWTMSAVYGVLLLAGALPMLIGYWAIKEFSQFLSEPTLARSILQSMAKMLELIGVVLGAALNGAGEFIQQQPATIGWLLVMVGMVALWGGVYQRMLNPQAQRQTHAL